MENYEYYLAVRSTVVKSVEFVLLLDLYKEEKLDPFG